MISAVNEIFDEVLFSYVEVSLLLVSYIIQAICIAQKGGLCINESLGLMSPLSFNPSNSRRQTTYTYRRIQMVRKRYHVTKCPLSGSMDSISLTFDGHACVQFCAALAIALLITQGPNMEEGTRVCTKEDCHFLINVA